MLQFNQIFSTGVKFTSSREFWTFRGCIVSTVSLVGQETIIGFGLCSLSLGLGLYLF